MQTPVSRSTYPSTPRPMQAVAPKPKLLDQVRQAVRARHYSKRTERTYVDWIKRFILFDFLGQNVRKYNGKLLIRPSRKDVRAFLDKVRGIIKSNKQAKTGNLIALLNPVIRGWAYYHRHVASSAVFRKVDSAIFDCLWHWARRRHRNKSSRWTYKKYFEHPDGRYVFRERARGEDGKPRVTSLFRAGSLSIIRRVKIRGDANPYDPRCEAYFERRLDLKMEANPKRRQQLLRLWISQGGLCTLCGHKITRTTGWRSHKVVWRVFGGSDSMSNRVLLHPKCHSKVHDRELKVVEPRLVKEALTEA